MNPYDILGVTKDSEQTEIKKSYRKLSLQFHPDRNSSEEAKGKMTQINDAYEKIGDAESRQQHDQQSNNPFSDMQGHPGFGGSDDIQNIFNMMFGGNRPGGMPGVHVFHSPGVNIFHGQQGSGFPGFPGFPGFQQQLAKPVPIVKNILLSLEQCYTGCSYPIEIERWVIINDCKVTEKLTINLEIRQGVEDNEIVILRECGNIINDEMKGDLKIVVNIQNTTLFKRDGLDLIYNKKITLKQSLCGFSFELKKLDGNNILLNSTKVITIIKPKFRKIIPMMGMTRDGKTGNMIIDFDVEFPETLTKEQIDALNEIL
jgi:DnaJ-class molecular chaperone